MKACANISPSARGGCNGLSRAMVSGGAGRRRAAHLAAPAQAAQDHATALQLAHVFRAAYAKLDQAPPPALSAAVRAAHGVGRAARSSLSRVPSSIRPSWRPRAAASSWSWPWTILSACARAIGWSRRSQRPKRRSPSCVPKIADSVLTFGSQAHLMGEPSTDISALRAAIRAIQPSDDHNSYAELAHALRSLTQVPADAGGRPSIFRHAAVLYAAQFRRRRARAIT